MREFFQKNRVVPWILFLVLMGVAVSVVAQGDAVETAKEAANGTAKDAGSEVSDENEELRWLSSAAECYGKKGGFTASFTHENISRLEKRTDALLGTIWASSTGRFKMHYREPSEKLVVFDGKKIRAFDGDNNLMVERPSGAEALFSSLQLLIRGSKKDLLEKFEIRQLSTDTDKSMSVLALRPKKNNMFAREIIVTLGKCPMLRRIIVVDPAGNMVRLTFSDIEIKSRFTPSQFQMKLPRDATIVRP